MKVMVIVKATKNSEAGVLEIRPIFEVEDFGANLTPEIRDRVARQEVELTTRGQS